MNDNERKMILPDLMVMGKKEVDHEHVSISISMSISNFIAIQKVLHFKTLNKSEKK